MHYTEHTQLNEVYMKLLLRVRRIFLTGNLERSSAFDNSPHLNHVTTATMMKTARCVANKKQNSLLTESEATSSQGQVNFSHDSAS